MKWQIHCGDIKPKSLHILNACHVRFLSQVYILWAAVVLCCAVRRVCVFTCFFPCWWILVVVQCWRPPQTSPFLQSSPGFWRTGTLDFGWSLTPGEGCPLEKSAPLVFWSSLIIQLINTNNNNYIHNNLLQALKGLVHSVCMIFNRSRLYCIVLFWFMLYLYNINQWCMLYFHTDDRISNNKVIMVTLLDLILF